MELHERERRTTGSLSQMNVIPLVDVVLVLLIIFMITAPFMYHGIDVNLPKTVSGKDTSAKRFVITIRSDRRIYINNDPVHIGLLDDRLSKIALLSPNQPVFLRADRDVPYGFVLLIMDKVRGAGIEQVMLVTTPLPETAQRR